MDLWKRLHALTVAWILTLVAPLPARAELRLTHRSERLRNGLTVILFEDHRAPVVTVAVRHLAGAGRDPEGRSGLAHLVEHLLSGKTAHMERQQRAEYYLHRMAPLAANALTSHDFAYYYETIPVGNLALALWLESERMRYALDDLDAEALNRERDIVRNESRQRSQLSSYGAGFEALFQAVFPAGHPYHRSVGGAPEDLQRITEGDVRAFYQRNYGPSGAVLLVGGDINLSDAAALVRRYFDDLPPSAPLPPLGTPPPRPCARQEIAAPSAAWPALLLGWPTPPLLSKEDALGALVAALLSRNGRGRLDRRVRALGLQGSLDVEQLTMALHSLLLITASAPEREELSLLRSLVEEEVAVLGSGELSDGELEAARAYVLRERISRLDGTRPVAAALGRYQHGGGQGDLLQRDLLRIVQASAADVVAFVRGSLRPEQGCQVISVPGRPSASAPRPRFDHGEGVR